MKNKSLFNKSIFYIKFLFLLFLCVISNQSIAQENKTVGLTLSGGGAQGFSHIGIIMALDSAGLTVDRINGTSCGAIVGGLYSTGFTGKQIEKICRTINWKKVFNESIPLRSLPFMEKEVSSTYPLVIPFNQLKAQKITGLIKGVGLRNELYKYFLPAYKTQNFEDLPIPFECVGLNLETGEANYFNSGSLPDAVYASMAIPSVFSPAVIDGKYYVDGGVVNNFPCERHVDNDIDYIIGVNTSRGLVDMDQINTPLDVMVQSTLSNSARELNYKKKLCNIYIEPDLSQYSGTTFDKVDEIIDLGIEEGLKWYPTFKRIADSLNLAPRINSMQSDLEEKGITISNINVTGLNDKEKQDFIKAIDVKIGSPENHLDLLEKVYKQYETQLYKNISQTYDFSVKDSVDINFKVEKANLSKLYAGLNYNRFNNFSVILGFQSRNILKGKNKGDIKIGLGQNIRTKADFTQFLNSKENFGLKVNAAYSKIDWSYSFDGFLLDVPEQKPSVGIGALYQGRKLLLEYGIGFERYTAKMFDVAAKNQSLYQSVTLKYDTRDRFFIPTKGVFVHSTIKWYSNQKYNEEFANLSNSLLFEEVSNDDFDDFAQILLTLSAHHTFKDKLNVSALVDIGVINGFNVSPIYFMSLGGVQRNDLFNIPMNSVNAGNIISPMVSRIRLGTDYFFTPKLSLGAFVERGSYMEIFSEEHQYIHNYGLNGAYIIGNSYVQTNVSYNQQNSKIYYHLVLGYEF